MTEKRIIKTKTALQKRLHKVINILWPTMGLSRYLQYLKLKITRIKGSDYSIAAGFACGAAVSMTPFLGLHFIMGAILAWLIGGNVFVSAIGTAVGNPWTFPIIFYLSNDLGNRILGSDGDMTSMGEMLHLVKHLMFDLKNAVSGESLMHSGSDHIWQTTVDLFVGLQTMILGGVIYGIIVWVVCYILIRRMLKRFHILRLKRLKLKRLKQREKQLMQQKTLKMEQERTAKQDTMDGEKGETQQRGNSKRGNSKRGAKK